MRAPARNWPIAATLLVAATLGGVADAQARKTPYYASISASQARMRAGPGRNFPASWLYQRPDLPVKVVEVHNNWRKIEDPDGTRGWMQANLLSEARTAMIVGAIAELRESPEQGSRILWRAEPGVVGRISRCTSGWCRIDVRGRGGFVQLSSLWGVEASERVP